MINRVDHIIIGKDIARTGGLTLGTSSASSTLADGEVVVLDKDKKLLGAGSTKEDSDTIYVGVGLSTTYYNPGQTTYTKRVMKISPAITNPVSFKAQGYTAATEKTIRLGLASCVAGQEYVVKVIYTDPHMTNQTSGQFSQNWRITARSATSMYLQFYNLINNDVDARVQVVQSDQIHASGSAICSGGTAIHLQAKSLTGEELNDTDEHYMINFDAVAYKPETTAANAPSYRQPTIWYKKTHAEIVYGYGKWQQIRDYERWAHTNEGVTNRQAWPPATSHYNLRTVKSETYDQLVIEYNKPFISADNHYIKDTKETLVVAIPNNRGNQMTEVLDVLNTWISSWGLNTVTL